MAKFQNLRTIAQLAAENPAFTEPSLRWLVFNSEQNGLAHSLVRIGRRVYVDVDRFNEWLEAKRDASQAA